MINIIEIEYIPVSIKKKKKKEEEKDNRPPMVPK